jgi:hypothetical protein
VESKILLGKLIPNREERKRVRSYLEVQSKILRRKLIPNREERKRVQSHLVGAK